MVPRHRSPRQQSTGPVLEQQSVRSGLCPQSSQAAAAHLQAPVWTFPGQGIHSNHRRQLGSLLGSYAQLECHPQAAGERHLRHLPLPLEVLCRCYRCRVTSWWWGERYVSRWQVTGLVKPVGRCLHPTGPLAAGGVAWPPAAAASTRAPAPSCGGAAKAGDSKDVLLRRQTSTGVIGVTLFPTVPRPFTQCYPERHRFHASNLELHSQTARML